MFNYFRQMYVGKNRVLEDHADAEMIHDVLFMFIADGLGNINNVIPSVLAIEEIKEFLDKYLKTDNIQTVKNMLMYAFHFVNKIILNYQLIDTTKNFATTLTAVAINKNKETVFVHVGDSRFYVIREGNIYLLSKDHTIAYELYRENKITFDDYLRHKDKNTLTQYLGIPITHFLPMTGEGVLQKEDIILLTTNGVTNYLTDEQIKNIVLSSSSTQEACEWLLRAVKEQNGEDDASVLISYVNW